MKKYNGTDMYEGLLFIKSMMSINNVMKQSVEDRAYAFKVGIECNDVAVDDGVSTSVDREQMRNLIEKLETGKYAVLVVEDLMVMMDRINNLGITIFDLGTMSARYNNYAVEC